MHSLQETIAALKAEISQALSEGRGSPSHFQILAERVSVTLAFKIVPDGQRMRFDFSPANSQTAPNTLTIDFKCTASGIVPITTEALSTELAKPERRAELLEQASEEITKQLSQLLGKPGFDSSARATVLSEALENFSDEDATVLLQFLAGKTPELTGPAKRAHALIQRVCQSGPAGLENGKKILLQILRRYPIPAVLRHLANVWKTQEEWLE